MEFNAKEVAEGLTKEEYDTMCDGFERIKELRLSGHSLDIYANTKNIIAEYDKLLE